MNILQKLSRVIVLFVFIVTPVLSQPFVAQSPAGPQLFVSPQPFYFGRIPVGSAATRELLIYNIGTQAANISNISIGGIDAGAFSILDNPGTVTLQPLERIIIPIKFQPGTATAQRANINIESNAGMSSDSLSGAGTIASGSIVTFERIIGDNEPNSAGALCSSPDGGYLLGGSTLLPDEDYTDIYLVKTDRFGQVEWTKTFGGDDSDGASAIVPATNGGYMLAANTLSYGAGRQDIYLVKLNTSGDKEWAKTFGGTFDDRVSAMIVSREGGYILVGATKNTSGTGRDIFVLKVDEDGNEIWSKNYGGTGGEAGYDIQQTADNSYVIVGSTTSKGAGEFDVYLLKLDTSGNVLWEKTFGGANWEEGHSVQQTQDGGFIIAGYTVSSGAGARDVYLLKTDSGGSLQWSKAFGDVHNDGADSVRQTPDGGYLIAGSTVNFFSADKEFSDLLLIKTDQQGDEQWQRTFGGEKSEGASKAVLPEDGGYLILGSTNSYSKDSDIYLLKLNDDGIITSVPGNQRFSPTRFYLEQNYPNPFNGQTTIRYHLPVSDYVQLDLFNLQGQKIETLVDSRQSSGEHAVHFETEHLPSGLYFYRLRTSTAAKSKRMLLLK